MLYVLQQTCRLQQQVCLSSYNLLLPSCITGLNTFLMSGIICITYLSVQFTTCKESLFGNFDTTHCPFIVTKQLHINNRYFSKLSRVILSSYNLFYLYLFYHLFFFLLFLTTEKYTTRCYYTKYTTLYVYVCVCVCVCIYIYIYI